MAEPIKPEEVAAQRRAAIPDGVIEAFNELIAKNFDGRQARIVQSDVVDLLLERGVAAYRGDIFNEHLLDVEAVYQAAGWTVTYDRPGYNEAYSAFYVFER